MRPSLALLCLLSLLVLWPGSPVMGEDAEADERARVRAESALLANVPPAVDRGVAWLLRRQSPDGAFRPPTRTKVERATAEYHLFGKTALATLTLTHCGRALEDPTVAKAVKYLRADHARVLTGDGARDAATYSLAIYLMALFELHGGARQLVVSGAEASRNPLDMPAWARAAVLSTVRWFLRTRSESGLFGYPHSAAPPVPAPVEGDAERPPFVPIRADLSNTQYALLGLWAGARCGEPPPRETLESLTEALLAAQQSEGSATRRVLDPARGGSPRARYRTPTDRARGFGYVPSLPNVRQAPSASMTAGGLSSLLVLKAMLRDAGALSADLRARLDQGIWDAIAWLTRHYTVERNTLVFDYSAIPPATRARLPEGAEDGIDTGRHGYYLYSLERAMVIGGKRFLGEHDWYLDGARLLLDTQQKDGSWRKGTQRPRAEGVRTPAFTHPDVLVDTCFALLFLQRATLRPRSPLLQTTPVTPSER